MQVVHHVPAGFPSGPVRVLCCRSGEVLVCLRALLLHHEGFVHVKGCRVVRQDRAFFPRQTVHPAVDCLGHYVRYLLGHLLCVRAIHVFEFALILVPDLIAQRQLHSLRNLRVRLLAQRAGHPAHQYVRQFLSARLYCLDLLCQLPCLASRIHLLRNVHQVIHVALLLSRVRSLVIRCRRYGLAVLDVLSQPSVLPVHAALCNRCAWRS